MGPDQPLPLSAEFDNVDNYVESLLNFSTSSWLLQTLCGGVHVLDFYTRISIRLYCRKYGGIGFSNETLWTS
jgi:hypothetical protein